MNAIQLSLFPDTDGRVMMPCAHCGRHTNVLPLLLAEALTGEARILSDPRVQVLALTHKATFEFLRAAIPAFVAPTKSIGAQIVADVSGYDRTAIYRHLRRLTDAGVIEAVPKRKDGQGKYHAYRLSTNNSR